MVIVLDEWNADWGKGLSGLLRNQTTPSYNKESCEVYCVVSVCVLGSKHLPVATGQPAWSARFTHGVG